MTKEEKELIEAISRDRGMAMTPIEELSLLGFYEDSFAAECGNEVLDMVLGDESTVLSGNCERMHKDSEHRIKCWDKMEEYDFDEDDKKYKKLAQVLRLNNDRRKYFA